MKGWKHLVLFSTLSLSLSGVDYSWQTTSPSNWSDSSAWNPSGHPNSPSDTATFDNILSAPITVTVDNIFSVDLLNFNSNFSYTLSPALMSNNLILGGGSHLGNIVLASTNTAYHFINVPLVLASDLNINFAPGSNGLVSLAGNISEPYSLTLTNRGNGVLIMEAGHNTYTGLTSILGGTMRAGGSNILPPTSNLFIDANGTFDVNSFNNTIFSLSGSGSVSLGGGNTLTVTNGGNFFGGITGTGNFALSGGTLVVATSNLANTYSGTTSIENDATLQAGAVNAFSPFSTYNLTENGTLDLHGFNNTIKSLKSLISTTTVKLDQGTLTINGGLSTVFSGQITGTLCGGLTISGGTGLLLSNPNNDYCGLTSIVNGTLQLQDDNTLSPNTDVTIASAGIFLNESTNRVQSITNSGTVNTSGQLLANFYTQSSEAILNLNLFNDSLIPEMLIDQNISLDGSLVVTDLLSVDPVAGDSLILIQSNFGSVINQFSSVTIQGFNPLAPQLTYTSSEVILYFAGCAGTWNKDSSGNWGDTTNWLPSTCVPGTTGNQNDLAIFNSHVGFPAITVTLANTAGTAALPVTLFQLNLDALTTQYTLNQFSNGSIMTFDGSATPQINVINGNHTINAPLVLNKDSELVLMDGAILNFNSNTTLQSASTQNFMIRQSNASTRGSGLLVNQTTLAPYSMSITSASMQNYGSSTPLNSLDIGGNTGTTVVVNAGANARLGPSGQNGNFTIGGTGSATIINMGVGAKMGSFGTGGLVTITSGNVTNSSGAVIQAGLGGTITISGGTVTNDLISTIGSPTENLVLNGGSLITTGNVFALDYTQSGSSTLQLNLTSFPSLVGNLSASGAAHLDSTLTVNALSGFNITGEQTIDLITAQKGISGTFSSVNFSNFPTGFIPEIIYLPNVVELTLTQPITPGASSIFSIPGVTLTAVNEINSLVARKNYAMHGMILKKKKQKEDKTETASLSSPTYLIASAEPLADTIVAANQIIQRKKSQLVQNVAENEEEIEYTSRFYIAPIKSFGFFKNQGVSQRAFGLNSVGIFSGYDHIFSSNGIGVCANYNYTHAKLHHYHTAHFNIHQIHGTGYATWVPHAISELAIDAIVGGGFSWYNSYRTTGSSFKPVKAKAHTQGGEGDALLGIEYIFSNSRFQAIPDHLHLVPFVNFQYIGARVDDYREQGAGIYGLKGKGQTVQSLRSCLGTRLNYSFKRKHFSFKPEFDLSWQLEYLDHDRNVNFITTGLPVVQNISAKIFGAGRNTLLFGVDFLFTIYQVFEIEMSYDLQWNNLYTNNTFYFGLTGHF